MRPDLSYAVGVLSQFMRSPQTTHLNCAKRVLRFVKGMLDCSILYRHKLIQLQYTDTDWAGDASDRRSTSGFMFSLGSEAISLSSKKHPTMALSCTKTEYRGAIVTACEAIWLKRLLKDLGESVDTPILVYCDNLSSIQLAKNPAFHAQINSVHMIFLTK